MSVGHLLQDVLKSVELSGLAMLDPGHKSKQGKLCLTHPLTVVVTRLAQGF